MEKPLHRRHRKEVVREETVPGIQVRRKFQTGGGDELRPKLRACRERHGWGTAIGLHLVGSLETDSRCSQVSRTMTGHLGEVTHLPSGEGKPIGRLL